MRATKLSVDTYNILMSATLGTISMSRPHINDELGRSVSALAIESLEASTEFVKLLWERIEELEGQIERQGTGTTDGRQVEDHPDSEHVPDESPRQ